MGWFANDIRKKMALLTRNLEVTLGPDTVDLQLRIGIHSGPVIGGVLRGARARFQLFGDVRLRPDQNQLITTLVCSNLFLPPLRLSIPQSELNLQGNRVRSMFRRSMPNF